MLTLAAEPARTAAVYRHPESLIWRDAGVLLGFMSAVAELQGLSFRILGLTGEAWIRTIDSTSALFAAGVALIGAKQ